jgi:hypothetical protein
MKKLHTKTIKKNIEITLKFDNNPVMRKKHTNPNTTISLLLADEMLA